MSSTRNFIMAIIGVSLLMWAPSVSNAQYREESSALEQIYESRARTALNTLLRPNEYSIVIAVDINHDPKQLGELEGEMDKMSLPGVPGLSLPENMEISNKLHELRNKISVHLILDDALTKEKEVAAKSLVAMKLHLDEGSGDLLTVARAPMVPHDFSRTAELLPELSWRMWALVALLSLMGLGWFFLYMQKRGKAEAKAAEAKAQADELETPADLKQEMPEIVEDGKVPAHDREMIELYERKRALVQLSTRYPEAASKALEEQFEKGHQEEVRLVFQNVGWEESKSLYKGIGHRTWARLGALMVTAEKAPTTKENLKAFEFCHKIVVAKYLELADGDLSNPFSFMTKLAPEDMTKLLAGESPQTLSTVCAYLDSAQKSALLDALNEDVQQATLLQLSKLREIPYDAVQKICESLRSKLKSMKENPSVSLDGQKFLVQLLGNLDVISEERFLKKLSKEHPAEMQSLRKVHLQFADLNLIPDEILSEALGGLDLQTMTWALYGADADLRFHLLKVLPEKRSKMVEKDLSYLKTLAEKDVLAARRVLVRAVNSSLMIQGALLENFLNAANQPRVVEAA